MPIARTGARGLRIGAWSAYASGALEAHGLADLDFWIHKEDTGLSVSNEFCDYQ